MVNGWSFGGGFFPLFGCDLAICAEVAKMLLGKNPAALKFAKGAVRRVGTLTYDEAEDYLMRMQEACSFHDTSQGPKEGIRQFIDGKSYKPGLGRL